MGFESGRNQGRMLLGAIVVSLAMSLVGSRSDVAFCEARKADKIKRDVE
jgi:hypothetical protein